MKKNRFIKGIKDGLPICAGYFFVAFAFGIFAVESGLSPLEALLISLTNVTSAGQVAAVPIICTQGSYLQLMLSQLVINVRYSLMSVILSQKLDESVNLGDKLLIAFVNTDEVFGVSVNQPDKLKKEYMFGLILTPYLGWAAGTICGAIAGDILPALITKVLNVAIYGMFIAIVVPQAKQEQPMLFCCLMAIAFRCVLYYCFPQVESGFAIIISALGAALLMALIHPLREDEIHD